MKILLITPYRTNELYQPIGLSYLAAYLRENGHEPVILDPVAEAPDKFKLIGGEKKYGLFDDEIKERILKERPDVIGVTSSFTTFHNEAVRISRICKTAFPSLKVLMGGTHPSMEDIKTLDEESIDIIVRGEGEVTTLKLLNAFSGGSSIADIDGITYRENGSVKRNQDAKEIADLDRLPMPAYDLLKMDVYLGNQRERIFPFAKQVPIGFMITSRGCPFKCTFCSTTQNWKRYRWMSVGKVITEIEFLVKNYGIKEIAFQDDSFLAKKNRVEEICKVLIERDLGVTWTVPPGAQIWIVNKVLLKIMKESGLYRICFPIETGNLKSLDYINKPVNLKKAKEIIKECTKLGVWSYGNFIIGFPNETKKEIDETLEYMYDCGLDMCSLYVAQPFAGSVMFDEFKTLGLLPKGEVLEGSTVFNTRYNTVTMRAEELNKTRKDAVHIYMKRRLKLFMTPRGVIEHVIPKINSLDKFFYFIRIVSFVIKTALKKNDLPFLIRERLKLPAQQLLISLLKYRLSLRRFFFRQRFSPKEA